jgi:protoporphyrinogen oxidase
MTHSKPKIAVIAGAGPAGLTAALELLRHSDIRPIVIEADEQVGGISKTINYRGNRMDLGGHRFFSKSDWVMRWWQQILPVDAAATRSPVLLTYQQHSREFSAETNLPSNPDAVLLMRQRLSRIYYRRRFFDYPLKLNATTVRNMGVLETLRVGMSYGHSRILRRSPEDTLEDFLINRFGGRLYRTFFKDYTEKVWGVPCREISAEWGAQRIKGLSISRAISHALSRPFRSSTDRAQKQVETSLIERFLYPKLGPGQMWEEVAKQVVARGGEIYLRSTVIGLNRERDTVTAVRVRDKDGHVREIACGHFVSSLPISSLVQMLKPELDEVIKIAQHLPYRDFMTAGLLVKSMTSRDHRSAPNGMPPDNWVYIQEPDVRIGRLQIFNNWSPALVADPATIWLGLEYFCNEGDDLWSLEDNAFLQFASGELERIGLIHRDQVIDGTVVRVPKAYPAYFGEYRQFGRLRTFLDGLFNVYPIGRNGMHRYNNQDHSMLAAHRAVTSIMNNGSGKTLIWEVNAEAEYHETAKGFA